MNGWSAPKKPSRSGAGGAPPNYTRTAGFSMIVLDASVVVELVTNRPGLLPASAWILIEASCAFALPAERFRWPHLGNCGRISPLTTPRTSLWQRQPTQSITPATRICRRAIGRGSRCLLIESNPSVSIGEQLLPSQICPGMPRLFRFDPE